MSHDVPINLSLRSWRDWEAMFRQTLTPQKGKKQQRRINSAHGCAETTVQPTEHIP